MDEWKKKSATKEKNCHDELLTMDVTMTHQNHHLKTMRQTNRTKSKTVHQYFWLKQHMHNRMLLFRQYYGANIHIGFMLCQTLPWKMVERKIVVCSAHFVTFLLAWQK